MDVGIRTSSHGATSRATVETSLAWPDRLFSPPEYKRKKIGLATRDYVETCIVLQSLRYSVPITKRDNDGTGL